MQADEPGSSCGPAERALRRALPRRAGLTFALLALSGRVLAATPNLARIQVPAAPVLSAVAAAGVPAFLAPALSALSFAPAIAINLAPVSAPMLAPAGSLHTPTPDETERARQVFLDIAQNEEELFDVHYVKNFVAPTLRAVFSVARAESALTDVANGLPSRIPEGVTGDLVTAQTASRERGWRLWRAAAEAENVARENLSPSDRASLIRLEKAHRFGLLPPLDKDEMTLEKARARLAEIVRKGRETTKQQPLDLTRRAALARIADGALADAARATPDEAAKIHERSRSEAKAPHNPDNARHIAARWAAISGRFIFAAPNLGRQLRSSCTLHVLRSLLAAVGIQKDIGELAHEARRLLNNPFVGSIAAFNDAMQRRLFAHYGAVLEIPRKGLFQTLFAGGRPVKIRIERGEPLYQHSLILEGLYELDGKIYVALRDSLSYFATRMELSDFAKVLTNESALSVSK